jgi:hypothetical protein
MKLSGNSDDSLGELDFDAAGQRDVILPVAQRQDDTAVEGRFFLVPIENREDKNEALFGGTNVNIGRNF